MIADELQVGRSLPSRFTDTLKVPKHLIWRACRLILGPESGHTRVLEYECDYIQAVDMSNSSQ